MATTSAFGWETPDDTDLVKDGAAAIRTLGNSIDTSMADLKGGTTGQVLSKASNTDMDFTWTADASGIPATILDAKGDIIAASAADTAARLAVGANDTVLTADSSTATGLKWSAPAASNGPAFMAYRATSNQSITSATQTKVALNAEIFDTDNCFDTSTYRFTPNKAGKYQVSATLYIGQNATNRMLCNVRKNGSAFMYIFDRTTTNTDEINSGSVLIDMNGTTDYLELYVLSLASTNTLYSVGSASGEQYTTFGATWIRS